MAVEVELNGKSRLSHLQLATDLRPSHLLSSHSSPSNLLSHTEVTIGGSPVEKEKILCEVEMAPDGIEKYNYYVRIDEDYQENSEVMVTVQEGVFHNPNGDRLFFVFSIPQKSPLVIYYSETELMMLNSVMSSIATATSITSIFLLSWSAAGSNYVVRNLVTFFHLAILYILAPVPGLHFSYREVLNHLF